MSVWLALFFIGFGLLLIWLALAIGLEPYTMGLLESFITGSEFAVDPVSSSGVAFSLFRFFRAAAASLFRVPLSRMSSLFPWLGSVETTGHSCQEAQDQRRTYINKLTCCFWKFLYWDN
jgi:hypothetical protein